MINQVLYILLLLFIFFTSTTSFEANEFHISRQGKTLQQKISIKSCQSNCKIDTSKYVIKGKVYDSVLRQGLPMASIKINNRNVYYTTDENGNFEFAVPQKLMKKNFVIVASYVMYEKKKIKIRNKEHFSNKFLMIYMRPTKTDLNKIIKITYSAKFGNSSQLYAQSL